MAKNAKKKISKIKIKKKTWFSVVAPKLFGNKEIGESYLPSHEVAIGRTLTITLRDLTGNMKDQNTKASFRITEFKNNALQTEVIGYSVAATHIKRLVRKNTSRIDTHFRLKTKDDQSVILKGLIVTRHKIQRSTRTDLQKALREHLVEEIGKMNFSSFVSLVVPAKIQVGAKRKLLKICPVKEVTVRSLSLVLKKGRTSAKIEVVPEEEVKEKAEESVQEEETPVEETTKETVAQEASAKEVPESEEKKG